MSETFQNTLEFAKKMDAADPLAKFRDEFHIAKTSGGSPSIYLCGNSLGLMPKRTKEALNQELTDWQNLGVEGHFHAKNPWLPYHEFLTENYAKIVGAKPSEVVAMNTLTVNLHLLMVSFYTPSKERYKIIIEGGAFPSDQYAVKSQIEFHGLDVDDALIELTPREGEETLRPEDIISTIKEHGNSLALVMMGGVNYYTGQFYNLEAITKAAHNVGAIAGFDLAHAAGNIPLKLHDWDVDFACWCSYKYLNSGPGSVAGAFVHERHAKTDRPRFAGWWGHDKQTRFKMGPDFKAIEGVEGWQLSNPPILSLAAVKASLEIFAEAGIENLREKSIQMNKYFYALLDELDQSAFKVITPRNLDERGCQFSIVVHEDGRGVFDALEKQGVICDWREPDCIRVAPVPLYNSFEDIYNFTQIFASSISKKDELKEAV